MSWLAKLYETYEAAIQLDPDGEEPIMPISHTVQNAHINITIDERGNFKWAESLTKSPTVLPATESSAGRSSGEAPHPLADKLQYVAKDYATYGGKKKAYFEGYQKQLADWCQSDFAHPKAKAVLDYISKGRVIADLIESDVVKVNENSVLLTAWKSEDEDIPELLKNLPKEKGAFDQGSALVRWTVISETDPNEKTWEDNSLQKSWVAYESSQTALNGLCYVTGKIVPLATNHPAKLRHSGDKAKLVSSNDMSGYTFRGRFTDSKRSIEKFGNQSFGIGFDTTQKAHNALRWLISRQGQSFKNGDQIYIAWAVSGKKIPNPTYDSHTLQKNAIDNSRDLGESFAHRLNKYMSGYHAKLGETDAIVIMGIDSATPGRMGISYYRELTGSEYLKRLEKWHNQFAWYQRHTIDTDDNKGKKNKKTQTIWPIASPAPLAIAKTAYGLTLTDNLKKNLIERIIPCIIDGRPFPKDIMDCCIRRVSNRTGYKKDETWLWEKDLGIVCSLYRGFCARHSDEKIKKEYPMPLDENYHARDYLYGQLLAVAEAIEEMAMYIAEEKSRSTSASRLMQRFSAKPYSTWLNIVNGVIPYQARLKSSIPGQAEGYKRLLDKICDAFDINDFKNDNPLTGEYLLGYHSRRKWLREHKVENGEWIKKTKNNNENNDKIMEPSDELTK